MTLDLDKLEGLHQSTTPGPWAWAHNNEKGYGASIGAECFAEDDVDAERPLSGDLTHRTDDYTIMEPIAEMAEEQAAGRNAAWIVAAHEAFPAMLDRIRALTDELLLTQADLERCQDQRDDAEQRSEREYEDR